MKNTLTTLFATVLLASCQPQGYTIEGTLAGENMTGKVYLEYPSYLDGPILVDSTTITEGKFVFKGKVDRPAQYHILMHLDNAPASSGSQDKKYQSTLYIDNSDITYHTDLTTVSQENSPYVIVKADITGSPTHDFHLQLSKEIATLTDSLKALGQQYAQLQADSATNREMLQQNQNAQEVQKEQIMELLKANASSIVGVNQAVGVLSDKSLSFSARQIELLVGTFKKNWANTAEMVALEFTAALAYPSKSVSK